MAKISLNICVCNSFKWVDNATFSNVVCKTVPRWLSSDAESTVSKLGRRWESWLQNYKYRHQCRLQRRTSLTTSRISLSYSGAISLTALCTVTQIIGYCILSGHHRSEGDRKGVASHAKKVMRTKNHSAFKLHCAAWMGRLHKWKRMVKDQGYLVDVNV